MAEPVVIKQFWVNKANDSGDALAQLKKQLTQLKAMPEVVTLVSAGEVKPFLEPEVMAFYQWLKKQVKVQLISVACVSLHGAILEFYHSQRSSGLVISLELSQSLQQACLNSLGVGIGPEQDGLNVSAGVGYIELSRDYQAGDMIIKDCQIISQPLGLSGITQVIQTMTTYLNQLDESVIPVSFSICSEWGKQLYKGLESKLGENIAFDKWLPSYETDGLHYLSLKPLHELSQYQNRLENSSLLIFTLGGGGRVGWLQLSQQKDSYSSLPKASNEFCLFNDDFKCYHQALKVKLQSDDEYYQKIKATLKYPKAIYRGIHNHYFQWQMS